jgi:ketosteroid isomerase-like protein
MKNSISSFALGVFAAYSLSLFAAANPKEPSATVRAAIEKLHQQDIAATLSRDPKALGELWDDDAVVMQPGSPAIVGKARIFADNAKEFSEHPEVRILSYRPDFRDLQICGDWAFEWGTFTGTYRASPNARTETLNAKLLRIMKRQADGSWKFSRVMWNTAEPERRSEEAHH